MISTTSMGIPRNLSTPQASQKPLKIFTPNAIKNLKSWHSERGQLDKIRIEIKQSTQAARAAFSHWRNTWFLNASSHQDVRRKVQLASLPVKEVRRRTEQNQDFSPDHTPQPDENKECDQKGRGRGYPPL